MVENVLHVPLFSMRYTQLKALEVNLLLRVDFLVSPKMSFITLNVTKCGEIYIGETEQDKRTLERCQEQE